VISGVKDAFLRSGGFIIDFHMFSNASLCVNFELPLGSVRKFRLLLSEVGMQLSDESEAMLKSYETEAVNAGAEEDEIVGTLQISFFHNEPDLRIEVPPIPG
jgi:hypothetical protein